MKRNLLFLMALPLMISCKLNYQVFQAKSDNVKSNAGHLEYQNEDCTIMYNLWSINGNPDFWVYNNSDKNIFIDLNQTQYIRNGIAYDYFLNREHQYGISFSKEEASSKSVRKLDSQSYSNSQASGIYDYSFLPYGSDRWSMFSNTASTSSTIGTMSSVMTYYGLTKSKLVTYKEKDIICIPSHSGKYFSEYLIANVPYSNCDLPLRPKSTDNKSLTFEEANTPLKFGNVIAYRVEGEESCRFIRNSFYVESIKVLTDREMYIYREATDPCKDSNKGKVASKSTALGNPKYVKEAQYYSPNCFYIKY